MTESEKYFYLLNFVKSLARLRMSDNDIYALQDAGYDFPKSVLDSRELLKEIGELDA